jgi:threonine/homoserine/homoserine lactone efflux protein
VTVLSSLASFAVIAGLLTIIPGLDTALVLRAAVNLGRPAGFATATGILTGTLIWGAAAAVGVSALLTASRDGYDALRLAGAAYLLLLGGSLLGRRWRQRRAVSPAAAAGQATACATPVTVRAEPAGPGVSAGLAVPGPVAAPGTVAASRTAPAGGTRAGDAAPAARPAVSALLGLWSRGVLTNLLNPKVGVFYVAMLPQFIPARSPHLLMGLALAGVHDLEGLIWFTLLIAAAHRARRWLRGDRMAAVMDRVTGTVLIAFGVRLALSRSQA